MGIPEWLTRTAKESIEKTSVKFSDETFSRLLDKYQKGLLDAAASSAVEEILSLLGVIDNAVAKLDQNVSGLNKAAKTESLTGDDRIDKLLEETPANKAPEPKPEAMPDAKTPAPKGKIPAKIKQPETTKWKEIRFNKRTGTWQTVVTVRHSRNFLTEEEAVEFTKFANKQSPDNK